MVPIRLTFVGDRQHGWSTAKSQSVQDVTLNEASVLEALKKLVNRMVKSLQCKDFGNPTIRPAASRSTCRLLL